MEKFLLFTVKIVILLLLLAFVLDYGYSKVYSYSNGRNKIENIINSGVKDYDVIFLGSSRANNHFDPKIFEDNGYKSFNYGLSGARLQESALMLQLMMDEKYKIKNIILEIDLNINSEGYSGGTRARFMPFLKSNKTISAYYETIISDYTALMYIPFYRYIEYDAEIGLRELYFSATNKPSKGLRNLGFYPLKGIGKNMTSDLSKDIPKRNKDYELIKQICKKHKINLIAVSTPMCENVIGLDYFDEIQELYPEVLNYENAVKEDKYFSSCGHLNEEGALLLTVKIFNDLFKKSKL
jgi:hypothetical protein